ncbi:DUF916 and DUF3324 domain-containing protein [Erysipelothrix sp. HDW6C]|uniref:DUF916 and DUF3324 domain-containing protein n=1 Tax=Erysipelothrix sp. HDW6C TaxID=2714930 RepID=UPI00140CF173|nr:DUF916 and DUF3324 domain-containing protein [Erysipelothrix sp. HDW6C]QIK69832.1 DUF916 and DUF3324 domain-containing protein [Erysipelothrix sp. HDW6C]
MSLKNKIKTILSLLMVFMAVVVSPISADAYRDFTIAAIIPENQINKSVDYFDLMMTPNQEQVVNITIENKGSETMVATLDLNNASTGNNGSKQYMIAVEPDSSMKTPLTSIATLVDTEIEVKPGETKNASIRIKMPATEQDGVILGGVAVKANTLTDKETDSDQGLSISNQLSYLIGLQLRTNNNAVDRNLNLLKVDTALIDFNPSIIASIQNDMPIQMNDISIVGSVNKQGTQESVATVNVSNASIMPNTNFNVVYAPNNGNLKPGVYDVKLRIIHDTDGKTWEWDETLTIESEDASDINDQAIFNKNDVNYLAIIIIAILVLIVVLLFILIWKRRKKDDNKEVK